MAIDPSIPLKGLLINRNDEMLKQEQVKNAQAAREAHRQEQESRAAERQAYGQVFAGMASGKNPTLGDLAPLGAINPEAALKIHEHFGKLDDASRKREGDKWKAAGPILARLKTVPLEQRGAFVQSAMPSLAAAGWTPQEIAGVDLSDQSLDALTATAMTVDQVLDSQKMTWHQRGEQPSFATDNMGNLINPQAVLNGGNEGAQAAPQGGGSNDIFGALIQQESGGNGMARSPQGALGSTQMLPATAQEMAGKLGLPWRPELLQSNAPDGIAYQQQLGKAYYEEGLQKYGGNVEQALKYYHGGPDESQWGPKTNAYAKSVMARVNKGKPAKDKGALLKEANDAIKRGADPAKVQARLRELGVL